MSLRILCLLACLSLTSARPLHLHESHENGTSHEGHFHASHEEIDGIAVTPESGELGIDEDELQKITDNFPDKDPKEMLLIKETLKKMVATANNQIKPLELELDSVTLETIEMIPVNLSVEIPHLSIAELNRNLSEYLHQGDIIANKEHLETGQDIKRAKRNTINALNDTGLVWETNKPIPYTIDSNIASNGVDAIHQALQFWSDNTCLSFKENGDAKGTTLIKFINGGGCYSSVGKQYRTSSQTVSIGGGCSFFGIAAHEIGHALGMWHAQSRVDRDDYVNVVSSNVYPNLMYNYVKETAATNYNHKVRYDYGSIMHYEPTSFAIDSNKPTLLSKDPGYQKTMGQRISPAFSDVWLINLQHSCIDKCNSSKTQCKNGGFPNSKNCSQCICPESFTGALCDQRDQGDDPKNCGQTVEAKSDWQSLNGSIGQDAWATIDAMKCYFQINAPKNKKLQIRLNAIGNVCTTNCFYGAVEIKVDDPRYYGYRFCCPEDAKGQTYNSKTSQIVIAMRSAFSRQTFALDYKYV